MNQKINPWTLGKVDEEKLKGNKYLNPKAPDVTNPEPQIVQPSLTPDKISGSYILMPRTNTYAKGVHALQEECKKENNQNHPTFKTKSGTTIYRPLTFKENIEARVNDFNTLKDENGATRSQDDRLRFFNMWLDSCIGVAYRKNNFGFKIVPLCEELIVIPKNFNNTHINIDYSKINGVEFNSSMGNYGRPLTKSEFLDHEAWKNVLDNDKNLHEEYAKIYYDVLKKKSGLGFYVNKNTDTDELRALYVDSLGNDSIASGGDDLNDSGSFLRVAQRRR